MSQLKYLSIAILAFSLFACGSDQSSNNTPVATKTPTTKVEEQPTSQQAKDLMEKSKQALNEKKAELIDELEMSAESSNEIKAKMTDKKPVAAAKPSSPSGQVVETVKKEAIKVEEKASALVKKQPVAVAPKAEAASTTGRTTAKVKETVQTAPPPVIKEEPKKVVEKPKEIVDTSVDHGPFDALLRKHVSSSGKVNYKGFKSDQAKLDAYLNTLSKSPLRIEWTKSEKMAYWINMYNAFTIKMIVDNYPVKSITDLEGGKPWDKKWIKIGSQTYSLNHIENKILRPQFKEAAIHFAVNCAAKSCPTLLNRAWTKSNLKSNFKKQATAFVNNPSFNKITSDKVQVSKIFEWYKEDFGNLISYLNQYSNTKISDGATIEYMEYDWQLNE